ncbi:hypothetical protein [Nonomuraea dietziae]|uniref:Alkaline ceramidase domain protein n=2 Tax=Nonomuraea dietziae TaxID=65515 RepID=A0A7W5YQ93_9ACTN|nr:hypothetical protein [Nonomuraea dietziae]MBB3729352.1 hypothetical protein [Nonomuraea dietziae]
MNVGYGSAGLAVPEGTPMGGYLDRQGPSVGTLDPLEVSAVTWSDGERRFALAVADLVCVNDDLAERAREAAGCELWLAATHTHAGPETGCVPGGGPTPEPWLDLVAEAVRTAVHRAVDSERPSEGVALRGDLRGVGADRSRPQAEAVVPLDVIAVRDGGLAGVVVVLPVHPTVLPATNLLVSADLAGAVRRALKERLGPGVWVVVATGAAGDISTRHTRRGQDAAELDRLGAVVADRCLDLLTDTARADSGGPDRGGADSGGPDRGGADSGGGDSGGVHSGGPGRGGEGARRAVGGRVWAAGSRVGTARRRIALARAAVAADAESLAADLERAEAAGDPVSARLARSRVEGLRARHTPAAEAGAIDAEVGVARVGGLALVGLPGEPFLAVADQIAEAAPCPTVVLGYVNGYPGYLPTADAYRRTEYEVLASQVAEGSAEQLAATALALLAGSGPRT